MYALASIIHDQWIMLAILMTYLDKPVCTQKHPAYRFQIWFCFESEHLEVYRGFGGAAPTVTGFGEKPWLESPLHLQARSLAETGSFGSYSPRPRQIYFFQT